MAAESTVRILFLGDSAQAVRSVSRLESSFGSLHKTTRLLAGGLAIGLVGGLAEATKKAIDFQRSMELIHTQAGASQVEVKKMSTALLGLARSVGTTPEDLSKSLFHIESAGLHGAAALKVLKAAAEGAQVGQADLESVTNALVAAQKSGVAGAGSMTHAMGVLNAIVGAGNMRMEDLTSAMGTGILSAASTFGISIQDVGAALGTMTTQGVSADAAATRLRMTFSLLAAPTAKAQAALKGIGLNADDLAHTMRSHGLIAALQELKDHLDASGLDATKQAQVISAAFGGGRTSAGIMTLIQHISDMHARLDQINKTTGDFGKAWDDTTQTVDFKLKQAKASIEAAAIPVGQLLLPLLIKAADAAGAFASEVERHMPQIQADFQAVGGVVSVLGQALGKLAMFALSPVGSSTLIGILAGAGAAKAIGSLAGLAVKAGEASTALTGVGVAGLALQGLVTPLAIGIGIFAGALYASAAAGDAASVSLKELSDSINGLTQASQTYAQASMALDQAHLDVKTSAIAVKDAEKAYGQAVRESGVHSEAARKAELALQQARLNHRQALAQEESATKANNAALKKQNEEIDKNRQGLERVANAYAALSHYSNPRGPLHDKPDPSVVNHYAAAMQKVAQQAAAAARAIPASDEAARRAAEHIKLAAQAAESLATELGRIPTRKEIDIYIRTHQYGSGPHHNANFSSIGRAGGGFVPSIPGSSPHHDSVPAMLTPGEVVLNRSQQMALGGPQALARMFGFTGREGPGFASGGIVRRRPPHRAIRSRHRSVGSVARRALHAVDVVNQEEDDADRAYGQLTRQYQITDPNGLTVSEIDSLIAAREDMLGLLAEEKRKLETAIKDLRKAITAMVKQIKQERQRIAALSKKLSGEQRKKTPDQKTVASLQNQITAGGTKIGNLHSGISQFQVALGDATLNLRHQLPFDVRDVQLDIKDLQTQLTGVGTPSGPDVSALEAEIARLNLALGLQTAQSAIIGTFAKGTLSVPETGLALLHAGEQVVPRGQVRGGDGSSLPPIVVNVGLSGPLAPLADFITATVDTPQVADRISVRIGQRASQRARSGRY